MTAELASLASRRLLQRLKESCVEHSLSIINEWVLREESAAKIEAKSLAKAIKEIESNVRAYYWFRFYDMRAKEDKAPR